MLTALPAQYAKFITSLIGLLVVYLQEYGATWHLVPAVIAMAAALGVAGVPNASTIPNPGPLPQRPQPQPADVNRESPGGGTNGKGYESPEASPGSPTRGTIIGAGTSPTPQPPTPQQPAPTPAATTATALAPESAPHGPAGL